MLRASGLDAIVADAYLAGVPELASPRAERTTSGFSRLVSHAAAFALGALLGAAPWLSQDTRTVEVAVSPVAGVVGDDPLRESATTTHAAPATMRGMRRVEAPAPADNARVSPADIAERARAFTVFVQADRYYGAGFLVDEQGHLLTSLHVVEGVAHIRVTFADGSEHAAKHVESDRRLDVALLKIDDANGRPVASLGAAERMRVGDDVFALGAPRKMAFSLSRGMVSFMDRDMNGVRYLQLDLALNGGSSGGPVMNERGEVVAISSFILKGSQGLSFALPIEYALERFALTSQEKAAPDTTMRSAPAHASKG